MARKVFMGRTSYQMVVEDVAKHSIETRSEDVEVYPIDQEALRTLGLYTREKKPNEATEFSITRFLTPYLAGYKGWVLFMDNDMLCKDDMNKLFDMADDKYAIMCVKHRYKVEEGTKLDGQQQTVYPRKNWSSVVLYNAGHPSNRILTPELINTVHPLFLHRFQWLEDDQIGELPKEWNYLADVYPQENSAKMIHFTEGGPYFKNYQDCDYADDWRDEYRKMTGKEFTKEDIVD